MQIIGVAGVVWNGETAVTDSHLAFSKRQREEAQLVQQTSQSLGEQSTREPVTQTKVKDSRINTRAQQMRLLLYFHQEGLRLVSLTQISAFVVMILLL